MPEFRTSQFDKLSKLISSKLLSTNPDTAKDYPKLLVNEVTVRDDAIEMKEPAIGLVHAVKAADKKWAPESSAHFPHAFARQISAPWVHLA